MINPHKLPSERDRRAVAGCLAASLGISIASRCYGTDSRGVVDASSSSTTTTTTSASYVSSSDSDNDGRMIRRARSFYQRLLDASVEFLFLGPDVARAYSPYLYAARSFSEGRNDDDERDDQHEELKDEKEKIEEEGPLRRWSKEEKALLRPFLESLSGPEGSFNCIALLVFRLLLSSGASGVRREGGRNKSSQVVNEGVGCRTMDLNGYDARLRYEYKRLAVVILSHWEMERNRTTTTTTHLDDSSARAHATRKFEALEDALASRISSLSEISRMKQGGNDDANHHNGTTLRSSSTSASGTLGLRGIARGLKIGAAGIAAGTIFAVTGGLAVPAIVGGIATIVGVSGGVATIVASVLLVPAATAIFGVGGGTIVARKVGRRTAGLGDFEIEKVIVDSRRGGGDIGSEGRKDDRHNDGGGPELSRTICISGWIRDEHDFERPFGISPRSLVDRHELLCRYCSVYAPNVMPECGGILSEWKGREDELWELLRLAYGRDPSSLLPLDVGPRYDALLTPCENKAIDELIRAMGLPLPKQCLDPFSPGGRGEAASLPPMVNLLSDVLVPSSDGMPKNHMNDAELRSFKAWDFRAEYGGSEVYVVRWEKELLLELGGSLKEFQMDLAKTAASEALKRTALATLMAAVAIPSTILSLSNIVSTIWLMPLVRPVPYYLTPSFF